MTRWMVPWMSVRWTAPPSKHTPPPSAATATSQTTTEAHGRDNEAGWGGTTTRPERKRAAGERYGRIGNSSDTIDSRDDRHDDHALAKMNVSLAASAAHRWPPVRSTR